MQAPFDFWTISLWLSVTAIIMLLTVQLISAYDGEASLMIEKTKLRNAAVVIGIAFLATVVIRVTQLIA